MVEAVTGWMDSKKKADEPEVILISTSDHVSTRLSDNGFSRG